MIKKILVSLSGVVSLATITLWLNCIDFGDQYHLTFYDISLKIDDATHNDAGIPFFFVRFFHNKLTMFGIEFFRHITKFWDVTFLVNFLSFAGCFGLFCGLYYLSKRREKTWVWIALFCLFITQTIEVMVNLRKYFFIELIIIWVLYQCILWYGLWHFLSVKDKRIRIIILIGFILLSVWWYLVFKHDIYNYCLKKG